MAEKAKSVAEIKAMEATVGEARESAKRALLESAEKLVADLWELGFEYSLTENTPAKKLGRPRKEIANGQKPEVVSPRHVPQAEKVSA
jgi:hypothetical protein